MATLYTPDGRTREISPADGVRFTNEELTALVAEFYDVVPTLSGGCMVIDDYGKMKGLDLNIPATRIYKHGRVDPIVGPALVVDSILELRAPSAE